MTTTRPHTETNAGMSARPVAAARGGAGAAMRRWHGDARWHAGWRWR